MSQHVSILDHMQALMIVPYLQWLAIVSEMLATQGERKGEYIFNNVLSNAVNID